MRVFITPTNIQITTDLIIVPNLNISEFLQLIEIISLLLSLYLVPSIWSDGVPAPLNRVFVETCYYYTPWIILKYGCLRALI